MVLRPYLREPDVDSLYFDPRLLGLVRKNRVTKLAINKRISHGEWEIEFPLIISSRSCKRPCKALFCTVDCNVCIIEFEIRCEI
jgi:hypothetical protein